MGTREFFSLERKIRVSPGILQTENFADPRGREIPALSSDGEFFDTIRTRVSEQTSQESGANVFTSDHRSGLTSKASGKGEDVKKSLWLLSEVVLRTVK